MCIAEILYSQSAQFAALEYSAVTHVILEIALFLETKFICTSNLVRLSCTCFNHNHYYTTALHYCVHNELITPNARTTSPFLKPQQAENTTDAEIFLEDICNRNASVEQFLASLITDAGHKRRWLAYQSQLTSPVVVHWNCWRSHFIFWLNHTTLHQVCVNRPMHISN